MKTVNDNDMRVSVEKAGDVPFSSHAILLILRYPIIWNLELATMSNIDLLSSWNIWKLGFGLFSP